MPDSMTGGCALVDVEGDGDLDIVLADGRWENGQAAPGGLARLLLQGADGKFTDVSEAAGVTGAHYAMGIATGDLTGDGFADLYISCYGPDQLLVNRGDGTFDNVSERIACKETRLWGASTTFCDLDGDGWLDIAVANYVDYPPDFGGVGEGPDAEYPAPANFEGTPDALLFNRGDGTFEPRSYALRVGPGGGHELGRGLGIAAGDWNGDGRMDLYVANDGQANHCWLQGADGSFTNGALDLGLALSGSGSAEAGMGVARGDVNGDGLEDLMLTHLVQETHTLYLARKSPRSGSAKATFSDATIRAGLNAPSINMTGFGAALCDLDLDGHLDFLAVHGRVLRGPVDEACVEPPHWRPYAEHDLAMLGDGKRFRTVPAGDFDALAETSRGLSVGDVDGDGDLDALVTTAAGAVRLYFSKGPPLGQWLGVRAVEGGRDALGAEVTVTTGSGPLCQTIQSAHGYLSSSEPVARFGLGDDRTFERLQVRWSDGTLESFSAEEVGGLSAGRVIEVQRGEGQ